jgi:hypothetical protein
MDQLGREYCKTHDPEIPEDIYRLARLLGSLIGPRAREDGERVVGLKT